MGQSSAAVLPEEEALWGDAKPQFDAREDGAFLQRVREELQEYLDHSGKSQADVAKAIGMSPGTISLFLRDGYQASGVNVARKAAAFLLLQGRRLTAPKPTTYTETREAKVIFTLLDQCLELRDFGIIYGASGIGKSVAAEEFATRHKGSAIYIRAREATRRPRPFFRQLASVEGVKAPKSGAFDELYDNVCNRLLNSGRLLIVDEAQKLEFRTFESLRDLRDEAGIGLVMLGNELIWQLFHAGRTKAQYEQLISRIGIRRCLQPGPTRRDVEAIARQYIDGLDRESLAYLHSKAAGPGGYRAVVNPCRLAFRAATADGGRAVTRGDLEETAELLG